MVSSESTYGDPDTRLRILDAAVALAAELGPSMRLADVSRAAGVSHQGLYLHFRGRHALLSAMLSHMVETYGLRSHYEKVREATDGAQAIERMVAFLGELNERLDTIGWVLEEAQHLDEALGRDWRRRVVGIRDTIKKDVIGRLDEEQSLRPEWSVSDASDLFLAVTSLGSWRELTRELGWTPLQFKENATRLIETSLLGSKRETP